MADPFSGIVGLLGIASQASHNDLAFQLQWMQYMDAKRRADKQERFAAATRSDAYGNKTKYNEALNEWDQELTPTQKKLLSASEREQLLSVTEDAERNRNIKRVAAKRGEAAGKDYNRVLADYRYNLPQGEASIRNALQLIQGYGTQAEGKSNQAKAITAALRAGQGGMIPTLIKKTDDAIGGEFASGLIKARQQAVQEAAARAKQHEELHLPQLQQFAQLMDQGGGAPQKFSELPRSMGDMQDKSSASILSALQSGAGLVQQAGTAAANAAARSPDFRLAGFGNPYGSTGTRGKRGYQLANTQATTDDTSGQSVYSYEPAESNRVRQDFQSGWSFG